MCYDVHTQNPAVSFVLGVSFLCSAGLPGAHCFPGAQTSGWMARRVLETARQHGTGRADWVGSQRAGLRLAWLCLVGCVTLGLLFGLYVFLATRTPIRSDKPVQVTFGPQRYVIQSAKCFRNQGISLKKNQISDLFNKW